MAWQDKARIFWMLPTHDQRPIDLRVDDIAAAYALSRDAADRAAGCAVDGKCRYCGRHWLRWPASQLDGHARCFVTEDFQDALWRLWLNDPKLSSRQIASACGVPIGYIKAWMYHADRRDRKARGLPEGPIRGWDR
jgi:hypothetical protein